MQEQAQAHAIVDAAVASLQRDGNPARYTLEPSRRELLEQQLEHLSDRPAELAHAVESLTVLAFYLDSETRSPEAAGTLLDLCETMSSRLLGGIATTLSTASRESADRGARFDAMIGTPRLSALVATDAPADSIPGNVAHVALRLPEKKKKD